MNQMWLTHIVQIFLILFFASGNQNIKYAENALVIVPQFFDGRF